MSRINADRLGTLARTGALRRRRGQPWHYRCRVRRFNLSPPSASTRTETLRVKDPLESLPLLDTHLTHDQPERLM
ncbi:hypothetical protein AGMMS50289_18030 [Betaproteobacteria bacterium]|nr:hypothetical protein AGMMS50289_18030 [Betaproteobacteria bacterium]